MSELEYLLGLPVLRTISLTLLHFLWQGTFIAFFAELVLRSFAETEARARYGIAAVFLFLMAAAVPLTFFLIRDESPSRAQQPAISFAETAGATTGAPPGPETPSIGGRQSSEPGARSSEVAAAPFASDPSPALPRGPAFTIVPALALAWLAGVAALAARFLLGWLRLCSWHRGAEVLPPEHPLVVSLRDFAAKLNLNRLPRLLAHPVIASPLTFGWIKPVILLPAIAITGLPREQILPLLAHELAHIRRHDYLVNLLQNLVETLLYFHPAVWWLSRRVREERELAADDLVVSLTGDRVSYARALTHLAAHAAPEVGASSALAATGSRRPTLLRRIRRLLGMQNPYSETSATSARAWTGLVLLCVVALVFLRFSIEAAETKQVTEVQKALDALAKPAPSGRVFDPAGQPLAGATVRLYRKFGDYGIDDAFVGSTTTGRGGFYRLAAPLTFDEIDGSESSDHYYLIAEHPDHAFAWRRVLGNDAPVDAHDLALSEAREVKLRFRDEAGHALPGVRARLSRVENAADSQPDLAFYQPADLCAGVADANGELTLTNLPTGEIRYRAESGTHTSNFWGFRVEPSKDSDKEVTLFAAASVSGRVVTPAGRPVANALVVVYPDYRAHAFWKTRTDEAGRYRIGNLHGAGKAGTSREDDGEYLIFLRDDRYASETRRFRVDPGEELRDFDLVAETGTEVLLTVRDAGTGDPVPGARIYADTASGRISDRTDPLGQFTFRAAHGEARIWAGSPPHGFYWDDTGSATVRRVLSGAREKIEITTPGPLAPLVTVAGRVLLPGGKPAAGAEVDVNPVQFMLELPTGRNNIQSVRTDDEGRFAIEGVPAEQKILVSAVSKSGKLHAQASATTGPGATGLAEPLRLERTQTLTVHLVDGKGTPLAGRLYQFTPLIKDAGVRARSITKKTGGDGEVTLEGILRGTEYSVNEKVGDLITSHTKTVVTLVPAKGEALSEIEIASSWTLRIEDAAGTAVPVESLQRILLYTKGRDGIPWAPDSRGESPFTKNADGTITVERKDIIFAEPGTPFSCVVLPTEGRPPLFVDDVFPPFGETPGVVTARGVLRPPDAIVLDSLPGFQSGDLAGRVVDPDGNPVAGASVELLGSYRFREKPESTDASGVFRFAGFKNDAYRAVEILADGYAPRWVVDLPVEKPFEVKLDGDETRFEGRFVTPDGEAAGAGTIRFEKSKLTRREPYRFEVSDLEYETALHADGSCRVPIEPGIYDIEVSTDGGCFRNYKKVSIAPGQVVTLDAELTGGASLEIVAVDSESGAPVAGAEFQFWNFGRHVLGVVEGSRRTTDAAGVARWDDLRPGNQRLDLTRGPWMRLWTGSPLLSSGGMFAFRGEGKPKGHQGLDMLILDLAPGENRMTVTLERGARISGVLLLPDGTPTDYPWVHVVDDDGGTITGDSRLQGYLMIERERAGKNGEPGKFDGYLPASNGVRYALCGHDFPGRNPVKKTRATQNERWATAVTARFECQPGEELYFNLRHTAGGGVTGRVVDPGGNPVAGIEVQAVHSDKRSSPYVQPLVLTDRDGVFRFAALREGAFALHPDTTYGSNRSGHREKEPFTVTVVEGQTVDAGDLVYSGPPPVLDPRQAELPPRTRDEE